jgi:hypothetical protein
MSFDPLGPQAGWRAEKMASEANKKHYETLAALALQEPL